MLLFKIVFSVIISSFVLLNMADKDLLKLFGLMPHEWIIFVIFILLETIRPFLITWVDKIFFVYFILAVAIPYTLNYQAGSSEGFGIFLPIKIWLVFRVTLRLFQMRMNHDGLKQLIQVLANIIICISIFAGVIGILRFMDIGAVSGPINTIWPIKGVGLDPIAWGRLVSTMSDTNGTGLYFVVVIIICFYMYEVIHDWKYLGLISFFTLIVVLTGSFTSMGTLGIVVAIIQRKIIWNWISVKTLAIVGFFIISMFVLISQIEPLKDFSSNLVEKRIESQIYRDISPYWFIPNTLYSRLSRWPAQLSIIAEKPFFGYGDDIPYYDIISRIMYGTVTSNPHNYYFYVLMHAGMVGFFAYIFFQTTVFLRAVRLQHFPQEKIMVVSVLVIGLVSQISLLSFQYGGYSELFGVNMALIYLLGISDRPIKLARAN